MFCSRCGTEVPEDSAFCHTCGTPVASEASTGGAASTSETRRRAIIAVALLGSAGLIAVIATLLIVRPFAAHDRNQNSVPTEAEADPTPQPTMQTTPFPTLGEDEQQPTGSPGTFREPPFDLSVEAVNVPGDIALSGSPVNVRVRVDVADDVWPTLSPADFRATVNLDGLQPGTYNLSVNVEPLTGRGGLRVTRVIPDTVNVELKSVLGKSVSVSVSLEASPPPGYEASVLAIEPGSVSVTGPQDRITLVTQAVATLDLTGLTEDVTQTVVLEPKDSRGFLVMGVLLEPRFVTVTVHIEMSR